jgi:glyoxylase-like metal-dependent hydrolase (beta-lactamase superfamily II)
VAEIDVLFQGTPGAITCHRAGDVLVDPGPASSVGTLLERLGGAVPDAILLTHIHLDHAGAAGVLVREWPGVEVWVHERGAPHLIDPSKLAASATRLYGDRMERLWGEIAPVPEDRVVVLEGDEGEREGWRWAYTPGHASHHVAYLRDGVAYTGDVAGVRIGGGPTVAPTPPPDIDVEAWHRSIDLVEGWAPQALAITHSGLRHDVSAQLAAVRASLDRQAELARTATEEEFERAVRADLDGLPEAAAYLEALPPANQYPGLARYWRRRNNGGA